jgi:hypothetical protein
MFSSLSGKPVLSVNACQRSILKGTFLNSSILFNHGCLAFFFFHYLVKASCGKDHPVTD